MNLTMNFNSREIYVRIFLLLTGF